MEWTAVAGVLMIGAVLGLIIARFGAHTGVIEQRPRKRRR